ncbi:hypothetical protein P22_1154 [Propionispora sp. 2/2-37]|uniref:glycosyltransferase family 4 protein n=1 Tax=Propionispora sp. 2/2-37 TaxID=1677858 RepID=UPI0006BB5697|nr:glycosyltransferase family 1 protein [Propionispora sp. 2/2-37]CUH95085.1 hypothetical protein P22_1154 [Propionispora sp. 2/2-37]
MRIVIDLQACQTEGSYNRGIGRYSLALAQAISRQRKDYEIRLVLNELYSELTKKIKKQFDGLIDSRMFSGYRYIPSLLTYGSKEDYYRQVAEILIRHHYAQLRPDILHISSVFEGCGGMAVVPGILSTLPGTVCSATLYDLIPLLMPEIYLPNEVLKKWYFQKLMVIRSCDLLLAISESTRKDAIHHLGIAPDKIVNISGAATPNFKVLDISPQTEREVRTRYGIVKRFVLYTGGIDHRKNVDGAISAFAKLPAEIRQQYQFVIVCGTHQQYRTDLLKQVVREGLQDEIVLTDYIPEEDLVLLYNLCAVFIFPSHYEGFGLPVLEAMSCGAAVIGANNSSIPEIIGRRDALFDSRRQSEITSLLYRALTDGDFLQDLKTWSRRRAKEFCWEYSAAKALEAFEKTLERTRVREPLVTARYLQRRKMAYFSPIVNSDDDKIAQYGRILLPFLARYYDITVYTDRKPDETDPIRHTFPVFSYQEFADHSMEYEIVIYNLEDILYPAIMHDMLKKYPGIVILHDSAMQSLAILKQDKEDWIEQEPVKSAIDYYDQQPVFTMAVGIFLYSPQSGNLLQQVYPHGLAAPFTCLTPMGTRAESLCGQEQAGSEPIEKIAAEFALAVERNLQQYLVQQQMVLIQELKGVLAHRNLPREELEILVNCAIDHIPKF